jgi:hypothetical protein
MRRTKQAGNDHGMRAIFDRDDHTITLTTHGSGDDLFMWTEPQEPTNKQLKNILESHPCTACRV